MGVPINMTSSNVLDFVCGKTLFFQDELYANRDQNFMVLLNANVSLLESGTIL